MVSFSGYLGLYKWVMTNAHQAEKEATIVQSGIVRDDYYSHASNSHLAEVAITNAYEVNHMNQAV